MDEGNERRRKQEKGGGRVSVSPFSLFLVSFVFLFSGAGMVETVSASQDDVVLENAAWRVTISPRTLRVVATGMNAEPIELSTGQDGLGRISQLARTGTSAGWRLRDGRIVISARLDANDLHVQIRSDDEGVFTWPVVKRQAPFKALIWPRAEGAYIPFDEPRWIDYLVSQEEWDTLASLSMPFWGIDCDGFALTYIATCPYNNTIRFIRQGKGLRTEFTHEFTRFQSPKEYGFVISLSENRSPIEPAQRFRRWLVEHDQFVSLRDKMKQIPRVERLLGAAHVYLWGDGVSLDMLERFREAGLDRLRLCTDGWEEIEKRPEVAKRADEMGCLFGTYDGFHGIHDPALQGTDDTWPTAQFDRELWERGKILRKNGTPRGGFKGIGAQLSPLAARPYVEQRVHRNMANVPYSYYFVDCDAYGEVFDDYSPVHPAGQADDAAARIDRLRWIGETFKVPVGSEGGCHLFAGAIHVSEGIFGAMFGWSDPDMNDKDSKYYLGAYYPPEGPAVFFRQVPIKEKYELLYYDPRYRLPLYETVFHDSLVATSHWRNASLKFENIVGTVALTELLYMTPPLYHVNLDEFDKHGEIMKSHYEFFSPLHRELGFARMTGFDWLSSDRLLQRTAFDDRVELIANYSTEARPYDGATISGRSLLAKWRQTGASRLHTPAQAR